MSHSIGQRQTGPFGRVLTTQGTPARKDARAGCLVEPTAMINSDTAGLNSGDRDGDGEGEQADKAALRARWEGFEFRVPVPGRVRVENASYGEDSDDHVYVVEVAEYVGATACTCPSDEYRATACKHRRAVENVEPVMEAATAGLNGAYAADTDADGGREVGA